MRPPRLAMAGSVAMALMALAMHLMTAAEAYNLEPRLAIVKEGAAGSHFGFSLAEHQIVSESAIESVLLVGAPLDREGGSLFKCPLTTRRDDCRRVEAVVATGRERDAADGQWLGSVVSSQGPGKQVIVCAHRHTKKEADNVWGQGRCFTLSQSLQHATTWDPCAGRDKSRAHEGWGYCQAGTSALITDDSVALIGSPGPFTWRGTVFALSVDDDFLFRDKTHYHTPVGAAGGSTDKYSYLGMSLAEGSFLPAHESCGGKTAFASGAPRASDKGRVLVFVKCHSELLRVQRALVGETFASGFGYSLAAADVDGDGNSDLFVGAPFFHNSEGAGGAVYYYRNGGGDVGLVADSDRVRITGKSESRFGFSLANAGDLNRDGREDLLVGAPYDDRGKVFVFMGGENGIATKPSQVISASDIPSSPNSPPLFTFGYSLSGGIDVDMNNHSDIAVGAFDSDTAVLIRSRPVIDITTWFRNYPKRIDASVRGCETNLLEAKEACFNIESCFRFKNFPSNIASMYIRYSLSAEVYPGGRKFSRVRFGDESSNATHTSERVFQIHRNRLTGCILETVYIKSGIQDLTTPLPFQLSLSLEQDEPQKSSDERTVVNINHFPILNQEEARKEILIPFLKSCGDDELCNSNLVAKLSIEELRSMDDTKDGASGERSLPALDIAHRKEIRLLVDVSNSGEPAYAADLLLAIDPSFSLVGRSDNASDINCDFRAADHALACKLGNPYRQRSDRLVFRVVAKEAARDAQQIASLAVFNLTWSTTSEDINTAAKAQLLKVNVVRKAEVMVRSSVQPDRVWFGGRVLGESAMKVVSDIGSKVTHTFQVSNDGPWHVRQLQLVVDWPHQLAVRHNDNEYPQGKWLLYVEDVPEVLPEGAGHCFLNPKMVNALGLRSARGGGGGGPREGQLLDAHLAHDPQSQRRRRRRRAGAGPRRRRSDRDQDYYDDEVALPPSSVASGVLLRCGDSRTLCQTISCHIDELRANESVIVRVRSRLWNSTLVEEFSTVSTDAATNAAAIVLQASARLVFAQPELEKHQRVDDDVTTATIVAIQIRTDVSSWDAVPKWAVAVAVLVGVLLVSVISLVLYKLGFFRRKRVSGDGVANADGRDLLISAKVTPSAAHAHSASAPMLPRRVRDEYIS